MERIKATALQRKVSKHHKTERKRTKPKSRGAGRGVNHPTKVTQSVSCKRTRNVRVAHSPVRSMLSETEDFPCRKTRRQPLDDQPLSSPTFARNFKRVNRGRKPGKRSSNLSHTGVQRCFPDCF